MAAKQRLVRSPGIRDCPGAYRDHHGRQRSLGRGPGQARHAGHKAGVASVRSTIEECIRHGVKVLTLFAFSSENWRRPKAEVSLLMELFLSALQREVKRMQTNDIQLRVIGDVSAFPDKLQKRIRVSEEATRDNKRLILQIAANYGGRWDIAQTARRLASAVRNGDLDPDDIDEKVSPSDHAE